MSDKRLSNIENTCVQMEKRLDSIDQTLVKNTTLLDYHIKRTNILEEEIIPIKNHVTIVHTILKGVPWILGILGALAGLLYKFNLL